METRHMCENAHEDSVTDAHAHNPALNQESHKHTNN